MQKLLISFDKHAYSFEQITTLINQESKSTQNFIGHELKQLEISTSQKKYEDDFLASLHFPEINCRQEEIKEAHQKTFQWIFDPSGERVRPWSNFIDWLQNGSGTYWVNGKAGSGKSTLMSYIHQDPRTKNALNQWVGSRKLLVPAFFFWLAGTRLQKTVSGLLRSLIYQILSENKSLIIHLDQFGVAPDLQRKFPESPEHITVWTEKRLLTCFSRLVKTISESDRICFFIDGLDEFDGDHFELIGVISDLVQHAGVKCCISSRPERPFHVFESSSMLRLQDLTRSDIEDYVRSKLTELPQMQSLPENEKYRKQGLLEQVVDKADGVFLWVELAVKSQILGLRYHDSFEILRTRLESLPSQLEGLYSDMLKRIDPAHYQEAAKYLNLILIINNFGDGRELPVYQITLAIHGLTDTMRLAPQALSTEMIASKCVYVHDRVNVICAGFLEIANTSYKDPLPVHWLEWEQDKTLATRFKTDWMSRNVKFCHRTALDFFNNSDAAGRIFLDANVTSSSYESFCRTAIYLTWMSLCNLIESRSFMARMVRRTMLSLWYAERDCEDSTVYKEYLNYVDQSISNFDWKLNRRSNHSHWCTRWGMGDSHVYHPKKPWTYSRVINPKVDAPHNSPVDFLSFAANSRCYKYVNIALDQPGVNLDPDKLTHLAICTIASEREWIIAEWAQFELVSRLVLLGADPRKGLNWSIWEEVLRFLHQAYLNYGPGDFKKHTDDIIDWPQILESFWNWGVDLCTILRLHSHVHGNMAYFECDPSSISFIPPVLGIDGHPFALQKLETASGSTQPIKDLRIWYRKVVGLNLWPPGGHHMTDKETKLLHMRLEKVFSCSEETWEEDCKDFDEAIAYIIEGCEALYGEPPGSSMDWQSEKSEKGEDEGDEGEEEGEGHEGGDGGEKVETGLPA